MCLQSLFCSLVDDSRPIIAIAPHRKSASRGQPKFTSTVIFRGKYFTTAPFERSRGGNSLPRVSQHRPRSGRWHEWRHRAIWDRTNPPHHWGVMHFYCPRSSRARPFSLWCDCTLLPNIGCGENNPALLKRMEQ